MSLGFLLIPFFAPAAEEPDLAALLPRWDYTASLRTGAGYKDNILLSSLAPESSAFISAGLEFFLWRRPGSGLEFQFLATADDRRYFSSHDVEKEQVILSQALLKKDFDHGWQSSLTMEYLYQDQVLDVSVTEANLDTVKVKGHGLQASPAVRRELSSLGWLEFGFPAGRQLFDDPLDDYWEGGPRLTFGRPYGHNSELQLSLAYAWRDYDERPETTDQGADIPGTELVFDQIKADLVWRHHWDEARRWRSATKLSYKRNQDNGSGYFDYHKYQVSEQLRYRAESWEISGEARLAHYDYPIQTVSASDSSLRQRTEVLCHLRLEKEFTRWLKIYAEYEFERTLGNQSLDEYTVNTITGGLLWEF